MIRYDYVIEQDTKALLTLPRNPFRDYALQSLEVESLVLLHFGV
jgi:hypothetical protein